MKKLNTYYAHYIHNHKTNIVTNFNTPAEHAFIVNNSSANKCNYLGAPFINNCDLDLAMEMTAHIFNDTKLIPKVNQIYNNVIAHLLKTVIINLLIYSQK